jgi:formate dehydrogenase subunit delta
MNIERLVRMANDIGNFFRSEPEHEVAVEGIASHMKRFWDPRMRREIVAHLEGGGDGLSDLAREAVRKLR